MKILIATGIYPPDIGGPATMLAALSKALEDNGFEVKILTYSDEILKDEKNIFRIGRKQNSLLMHLKYFLKMLKLSRWADVVYVTDTYSVGYFAYWLKRITGKQYILRFAGDSAWETAVNKGWTRDYITDFQEKVYDKKIEKIKERRKIILVNADRIIAVCNFLGELAARIGVSREKIKVIYNSIDFAKREGRRIGLRERFGKDAKIMVYSGRLVPWKGISTVIKIMPKLINKLGNVNFLVLGDGPESEKLKKLASGIDVREKVHFLGRISHDEIINYLRESDLFVLNTNYEGLSHAILEAMDSGAPVVTTAVGGNPEIIDNGKDGLLIHYNNKEELFEAAVKILTNDDFKKSLIENAKEKLKKFNWEQNVKETIKVIKETIFYEKSSLN